MHFKLDYRYVLDKWNGTRHLTATWTWRQLDIFERNQYFNYQKS